MRQPTIPFLVFALAILLPACSTLPKVHTEVKPGADYGRYHTYALMPLPASGPASDPGLMLRVAEPVRQAVAEAFTAKGIAEATRAQADIAVNLRGSSFPKVDVTQWGYTRTVYGRRFTGVPVQVGTVDVETYEERTLTVEIFDNRTHELVWVGWSRSESRGKIQTERLQQAIRNILAAFPAGTPASPVTK